MRQQFVRGVDFRVRIVRFSLITGQRLGIAARFGLEIGPIAGMPVLLPTAGQQATMWSPAL